MASAGTGSFLLTFTLLVSCLMVHPSAGEGDESEQLKMAERTVVQGMVMCQSCEHRGSWSLEGATGLEGATIGISCRDHKFRVTFFDIFTTGSKGYFYAPLDGLAPTDHHKDTPIHACKVHLIASMDPSCNLLTNTNRGIGGSDLRFVKRVDPGTDKEADLYSVGPLAFRPINCFF